jgi:ribonuclease PH
MAEKRQDGRLPNQVRPITIQYDVYGYADASVLFELGQTKVLVGVTLQQGVPPFLKGQKVGWLTAEYAMLPSATCQRTVRESNQNQRNSRSVEISRLIGRCLRPTVDLTLFGEKTIIVDCDVLQADGSTRVACITAASLALSLAAQRWMQGLGLSVPIFKEHLVALSVGLVNDKPLVDLSYVEDSQAEADFNFITTKDGALVEVQGTCEKKPIPWDCFDQLRVLALQGVDDIWRQCTTFQAAAGDDQSLKQHHNQSEPVFRAANSLRDSKQAFFSLASRTGKK